MGEAFDISYEDLPAEIPVFPLPRVMLLPRVLLPLNIFEPRYLAMVRHALASSRLIGMIQPDASAPAPADALHKTGCAGRITSFSETEDGRYLITLKGVCRFHVDRELDPDKAGFRRVAADWAPFAADLAPEAASSGVCREAMMVTLRAYLDRMNMFCDKWEEMKGISCEKLVSTLSVVCVMYATGVPVGKVNAATSSTFWTSSTGPGTWPMVPSTSGWPSWPIRISARPFDM